jgi:hypothetical protein
MSDFLRQVAGLLQSGGIDAGATLGLLILWVTAQVLGLLALGGVRLWRWRRKGESDLDRKLSHHALSVSATLERTITEIRAEMAWAKRQRGHEGSDEPSQEMPEAEPVPPACGPVATELLKVLDPGDWHWTRAREGTGPPYSGHLISRHILFILEDDRLIEISPLDASGKEVDYLPLIGSEGRDYEAVRKAAHEAASYIETLDRQREIEIATDSLRRARLDAALEKTAGGPMMGQADLWQVRYEQMKAETESLGKQLELLRKAQPAPKR